MPFVLDMDSTAHPQSGTKIEGTSWNFKNEWALDSLSCFDNLGFGYGFELRPGSTYSSVGGPEMLRGIAHALLSDPHFSARDIYFRADSAFCNEAMIRECLLHKLKFTLTAHGNLRWEKDARNIPAHEWKPWEYPKEQLEEAADKGHALPKVEVAAMLYTPSWAENIRLKLVVKRTWQVEEGEGLFQGFGYWDYYGVVTNITDYREEPQAIIKHHQQRGNAENRIKAMKGD